MGMAKMGVRLLSALAFAFFLMFQYEDSLNIILAQFIVLYLVFMTFEIVTALSNLREN